MSQVFSNNASSTLYGALPIGVTTLVLPAGTGEQFPNPVPGDHFLITLYEKDEAGNEVNLEIVSCTQRVADTLTIARDIEGLVGTVGGRAYPSAAGKTVFVQLRWTASSAAEMLQKSSNLSDLPDVATARTNLGLGNVDNTADLDKPISTATQSALDGKSATSHDHSGVYEPADATILKDADIGVTVQAYDADLTSWAGIAPSAKQDTLVSGTNLKTVNSTTLLGSGNIVTGDVTLTGTQTLTNKTLSGSVLSGDTSNTGRMFSSVVAGSTTINCASGNYFTYTASTNTTFAFSNPPTSGKAYAFTLELTHTAGTITWPATVQWSGGTAPTLTTGKTHLFVFVTDDGGTRWRGVANVNYTN